MPTAAGAVSRKPNCPWWRWASPSAIGLTVAPDRERLSQLRDQRADDRLAETATLVRGLDGDIGDLEEQAAVADHPAHADDGRSPVAAAASLFGLSPAATRRRRSSWDDGVAGTRR